MWGGRTEASVSLTALHGHGYTQSPGPAPSLVSGWVQSKAGQSEERQQCQSLLQELSAPRL